MEPDEFLLVSSRDGIEVIGSIVLEDQRLFNRVSCGMEVLLKPVMHPETHNIRWIEVVYIRQDPEHPPVYHPAVKPKVDSVIAIHLGYEALKDTLEGPPHTRKMVQILEDKPDWVHMGPSYTFEKEKPRIFKWLRNLFNKE